MLCLNDEGVHPHPLKGVIRTTFSFAKGQGIDAGPAKWKFLKKENYQLKRKYKKKDVIPNE